ncbi:type II toxin-antitoxin system RelE/ParE family toxin [Gilvimarinus chinensis]|uniref:type II toxin-antitoxin system RelE/ParE family toxin n=1 Tax=Gilvimarinus chinensis TaxID=396005 RepID=UPI00036AB240
MPGAAKDVARLRRFIEEKNPGAARRAASRIIEATPVLMENPEAGRPVEEALPFRDLFISFGSGHYILRYRPEGDRIVIARVRHSKKQDFS